MEMYTSYVQAKPNRRQMARAGQLTREKYNKGGGGMLFLFSYTERTAACEQECRYVIYKVCCHA